MLAADRADHVLVLGDEGIHLVKGHGVHVHALAGGAFADQLVGAVAALAGAAVQKRVREAGHMAGGDPGLGVHQDGGIQAHVVGAFLHELFQPGFLDVVFELDAQGAVVPAVGQAAVDLAAGVDEPAVFAQVDDHVQCLFAVFHLYILLTCMAGCHTKFCRRSLRAAFRPRPGDRVYCSTPAPVKQQKIPRTGGQAEVRPFPAGCPRKNAGGQKHPAPQSSFHTRPKAVSTHETVAKSGGRE